MRAQSTYTHIYLKRQKFNMATSRSIVSFRVVKRGGVAGQREGVLPEEPLLLQTVD